MTEEPTSLEGGEVNRQPNWLGVMVVGGVLTLLTNLATGAITYAVNNASKQTADNATTAVELRVLTREVSDLRKEVRKANDLYAEVRANKGALETAKAERARLRADFIELRRQCLK